MSASTPFSALTAAMPPKPAPTMTIRLRGSGGGIGLQPSWNVGALIKHADDHRLRRNAIGDPVAPFFDPEAVGGSQHRIRPRSGQSFVRRSCDPFFRVT